MTHKNFGGNSFIRSSVERLQQNANQVQEKWTTFNWECAFPSNCAFHTKTSLVRQSCIVYVFTGSYSGELLSWNGTFYKRLYNARPWVSSRGYLCLRAKATDSIYIDEVLTNLNYKYIDWLIKYIIKETIYWKLSVRNHFLMK